MKPRIAYLSKTDNITRYEFIYPDADGYKNWVWTEFDKHLISYLQVKLRSTTYACHLNQPKQPNGLTFLRNIESIFGSVGSVEIESVPRSNSLFYKVIGKVFSAKNENTFYCGDITDNVVKNNFLSKGDLGCFWYVFFIEQNRENFLFRIVHECGINNDISFVRDGIKALIYRDYLKNSISIVLDDKTSEIISEVVSKYGIFLQEKNILNILDTSYLDLLPSKIIRQ